LRWKSRPGGCVMDESQIGDESHFESGIAALISTQVL
jgi:hypothetical protein